MMTSDSPEEDLKPLSFSSTPHPSAIVSLRATRSCLLSNQQLQILGFTDGSSVSKLPPLGMSRCLKQTTSPPRNLEKAVTTAAVKLTMI